MENINFVHLILLAVFFIVFNTSYKLWKNDKKIFIK
jgi:hypothetical protein